MILLQSIPGNFPLKEKLWHGCDWSNPDKATCLMPKLGFLSNRPRFSHVWDGRGILERLSGLNGSVCRRIRHRVRCNRAVADGEYGMPYVVYRPCLQRIRATSIPSNSPCSYAFLIKVPFSCLLLRSFVFLSSPGCFV
jgi:hypothetical protein